MRNQASNLLFWAMITCILSLAFCSGISFIEIYPLPKESPALVKEDKDNAPFYIRIRVSKKVNFPIWFPITSLSELKSCMTAKSVTREGTLQLRYCFCTAKFCNLLSGVFFFPVSQTKAKKDRLIIG